MSSTADLVQSNANLSDQSFKEKIIKYFKIITVEPLIASYLLSAVICLPALLTLELEKTCRANLKLNQTVCNAIKNSQHEKFFQANEDVTIIISNMHSWQSPLQNIAPLILVLFLGSYSDRHRIRKPFMILPLVGELFAVLGCILSVIFMDEWPVEIQGVLQTVVPSLFGGVTMLIMAVFSYIGDDSSLETRTLRVALIQIVINVTTPIGQILSAVLYERFDYIGVLTIAAVLYSIGITYGIFYIKEPKKPKIDADKNVLLDLFDPTNAIDTLKILFKKNPQNNRILLVLILFMFFIVTGIATVDILTFFSYLQNTFHWTGPQYSYFSSFNTVVHLIGVIVFVPLFTKVFHLSDIKILLFTYLDKISTTIVYGFASTNLMFYIGSVVSIITNITLVALRSLATKVVSQDDLGKAQSLFSICESLGVSALTPLFNTIFVNTIKTFPAAFIFAQSIAYALCFFIAVIFYFQSTKRKHIDEKDFVDPEKSNGNMDEIQVTHM